MKEYIDYNQGDAELRNWIVAETDFNSKYQGKCESIFCQGNGYLGTRSATEESYYGQVRGLYVAGTFNKCHPNEVTELPNAADMTGMDILIDGELFTLEKGEFSNYRRSLNLKQGELIRKFVWTNKEGKKFDFEFKRFVSANDLHTLCTQVSISPIGCQAQLIIKTGINGQVTNTGAQHFEEGEKRIFDREYLQMLQKTNQSEIVFILNTHHSLSDSSVPVSSRFEMERRKVFMVYEAEAGSGHCLNFSKISNIYTTRDMEMQGMDLEDIRKHSLSELKKQSQKGYELLLQESSETWDAHWKAMDISVDSNNPFDQLAIRFVLYQLMVMTPKHDARMGIAAKGLSGEGYKGHSFWDTEIFILPFFTYTFPQIARGLLGYRHNTLTGARKKATKNSYKGAMYPWESAWADDGEVTPVWGTADIVTGKATKILSGFIEQHITSDIAFAVWQYYMISGDEDFMKKFGYEILFDTAIFWGSRLEWDGNQKRYHINNVLGPDEYKEHVNNDAFTNYMAKWCMDQAVKYYHHLKENGDENFERLNQLLNLDAEITELKEKAEKIFLPAPNDSLLIPQDDTYLKKELIDLGKYKDQDQVDSIFRDYNLDQVNQIQVTKQASVVLLLYLLEHFFDHETKEANYHYYESRTTHDSSLSLSIHAVLASDLGDLDLAYSMFEKAARIDLGPNMNSSDKGIHAASLGGLWQIIVCGFGGVRMTNGKLRINPALPDQINSISYPIVWNSNPLNVTISRSSISIINNGAEPVTLTIADTEYRVEKELTVKY